MSPHIAHTPTHTENTLNVVLLLSALLLRRKYSLSCFLNEALNLSPERSTCIINPLKTRTMQILFIGAFTLQHKHNLDADSGEKIVDVCG